VHPVNKASTIKKEAEKINADRMNFFILFLLLLLINNYLMFCVYSAHSPHAP